ncbi:MAG: sigma-70 family RNA polymerase sigma factor [Chloroflexota bacterium]
MQPTDDDRARFEAAFEVHQRRVLAYVLRRVEPEADAEDVVAETFMIAWRRLADLPSAERALPWLLAVARRVAANRRRGSRRWSAVIDRLRNQPQMPSGPIPESPATEALSRLRPDDQELLRLIAWDGLSHAEVGEVIGISSNAVAIRLHRARRRFATELAAAEGRPRKGIVTSRTPLQVTGSKAGPAAEERTT